MNRLYRKTAVAALTCATVLCLNSCLNRNVKPSETQVETVEETPVFLPGDQVPDKWLDKLGADSFFKASPIEDDMFALMQGKSYREGCPTPREDLRYLTVLHKDSLGRSLVGEMVVNKSIADDVLEIFQGLYQDSYPIEKMRLVDYYDADDRASMLDNNSSAFNYRPRSHQSTISKHALGLAIDINPLYNPYCLTTESGAFIVEPKEARPYANRNFESPYKIEKGDLCWTLFRERGFFWGGGWAGRTRDYQHFEK